MNIEKLEERRKEYKMSKKGFECIGPCYRPGIVTVHPITLQQITNIKEPFCAVNEWEDIDPYTGKKVLKLTDVCTDPVRSREVSTLELAMNIISPEIDFTSKHFLKIYYSIFSMEAAISWIEDNSNIPYYTKKRVIDSAWKSYGFKNYTLDDRLIIFYVDLIRERETDRIFNQTYRVITSVDGEFKIQPNNDNSNVDVSGKKKFIRERLITNVNFTKFITQYIEKFSSNSSLVRSHTDNIITMFVDFIQKKIDISLRERL